MLEEIADSMTTGGVLAATVGFCVALLVLVMRVRERNLRGPHRHAGTLAGRPVDVSVPPSPGSTSPDDQPVGNPEAPAATDRPASVFKPYVPPKAPRGSA